MQLHFQDQVVVITGGSRGIGAAAVRLFAQSGARIVFNYLKATGKARQLVREVASGEGRIVAVRADISRVAGAQKLVGEALKRFGGVHILVANAGIWNAAPAPIEKMTEKQWDEMMAINLKGVYSVIRCAVPSMMQRKSGRIIVVSSTAGQRGEAFHTHYGASKGGVISFVKGLSTELAPHGILVNCVAPGWVDTEMAASVTSNPRELRAANRAIPLRRFARPEEIAMPILFLASKMASYITGEVLNVNGGNVLCG